MGNSLPCFKKAESPKAGQATSVPDVATPVPVATAVAAKVHSGAQPHTSNAALPAAPAAAASTSASSAAAAAPPAAALAALPTLPADAAQAPAGSHSARPSDRPAHAHVTADRPAHAHVTADRPARAHVPAEGAAIAATSHPSQPDAVPAVEVEDVVADLPPVTARTAAARLGPLLEPPAPGAEIVGLDAVPITIRTVAHTGSIGVASNAGSGSGASSMIKTAGDAAMFSAPGSSFGTVGSSGMPAAGGEHPSTAAKESGAPSNFMFGAPRMKEGKEKKDKKPKRIKKPKSNQSGSSAASGVEQAAEASSQAPSGSQGQSGTNPHTEGSTNPNTMPNMISQQGSSVAVPAASAAGVTTTSAAGSSSNMGGMCGSNTHGSSVGKALKLAMGSSHGGSMGTKQVAAGHAHVTPAQGALPDVVEEIDGAAAKPADDGESSEHNSSSPRSSSGQFSIVSPPEGSDVENVLMLICNIFQLPVALVAAFRSSNIFIRSTAMKLTTDEQWKYSLAQWSMINTAELKDVLMVPNATMDDRFGSQYCVQNEPRIIFFMASPLRGSTGEMLGTLCMADFKERQLDFAQLLVVNNLQSLVIRQLERDMSLAQERINNEAATEALHADMMRALDHFEKCIMFVDTSVPGWEVLYTNLAWEKITGVPRVHVQGRSLQDCFQTPGGALLDWTAAKNQLATRGEFQVERVAVRQKPDKLVTLHLRCADGRLATATTEADSLLPAGLPAWVKARGNVEHNYFVWIEEAAGVPAGVYEALAKHVEKVPGLELSHLLGKGGFGSVYYGTWNSLPVAVKMIDQKLARTNTEGVSLEALMGQELDHPNIVKTIKYVMRQPPNANGSQHSRSHASGSQQGKSSAGGAAAIPRVGSSLNIRSAGSKGPNSRNAPVSGGQVDEVSAAAVANQLQYLTSAQPGLHTMTSAQYLMAQDLTSASAMVAAGLQDFVNTPDMEPSSGARWPGNSSTPAANMAVILSRMQQHAAAVAAAAAAGSAPPQQTGPSQGGMAGFNLQPGSSHVSANMPVNDRSIGDRSIGSRSAGGTHPGSSISTAMGGGTTSTTSNATAVGPPSQGTSSATAVGPPSQGTSSATATGPPSPGAPHLSREVSHALGLESVVEEPGLQPQQFRPPTVHRSTVPPGAQAGPSATQMPPLVTSALSLAFSTVTSQGGEMIKGSPGSSSDRSSAPPAANQHSANSAEDVGEIWIIMEYCDRGSLQDGLDVGLLKLRKASGELGETHLPMMVATACEVASAMAYLHNKGIVHGDLTAWNVMLMSHQAASKSDRSGRTFVAKVADFGLSRTMDVRSKIKTRTYGTITHMPPETLISGIISKAADVFSFGVLLWQMYTGMKPWAGMNHGQIIYNVGMKNVQLLFPPGTPPIIADLSSSCTRTDPSQRPSFNDVVQKLDNIRASLGI